MDCLHLLPNRSATSAATDELSAVWCTGRRGALPFIEPGKENTP